MLAIHRLVDDLQGVVADAVVGWPELACKRLRKLGDAIPVPGSRVENVFLRALLFEYACHASEALHHAVHPGLPAGCSLNPIRIVSDCFGPLNADARAAFCKWAGTYTDALRSAHPATKAEVVAITLIENPDRALDGEKLARSVGLTAAGLRRAFRAHFGLSIREYQASVRLLTALQSLRVDKVIAVARRVGYRNPKNFYRALHKVTGFTPTGFRALTQGQAEVVISDAWARLWRGKQRSVT